jgi:choline dehydrogenase
MAPRLPEDVLNTYDIIIVGGGSAGCVAAWRLVRDHGLRVLVLERGPRKPGFPASLFLRMPAAWMKGIKGSPIVEMHTPLPQAHLNGRAPSIGQAAMLGGGSSVNAMVYTRGQHEDYDNWDNFLGGNTGWAFKDMLPHFKGMEHNHSFNDAYHGVGGPLHVSASGAVCAMSETYCLTLQGMGVPFNPDFNGAVQAGVGIMQYTTKGKERCDGVRAFLDPLEGDGRLTVMTECLATRLIIENGKAVGVAYRQDGQERIVRCEREVLVASGTFHSAKLLMLSGLGPAAHLQQHGIRILADLPGIGENLQDHHETPIVAATNGAYGYFGEDRGLKMIMNGLRYLLFKDGPVASVGVEACAYIDPDGTDRPSIKMYCVPTVYLDGDVKGIPPQHGVTLNACLLRPQSRGTVRLASSDPLVKPLIDNNYLAAPDDLRREISGLRYARRILASEPLKSLIKAELAPGRDVTSDEDLGNWCRKTVKTNWHPVGTCRMGKADDPMAVLDSRLRVRGVDGLRVIDASAMPFIPSGNTNAPTMALADRAVHLMMSEG